jgi:anti-repressor protein
MISEPDLMRLTCRSKMPDAVRFEKWVFEEVLPEIRKTGAYVHATPEMDDVEIMARAIFAAQRTIERNKMIIEEQEKKLIAYALKKEGTTRKAAEYLNLPQATLARKKVRYGL